MSEPAGIGGKWLYGIKTVLEMFAILVGGWWVLSRFLIGDLPSLSPRISIDSTLTWSPPVGDSCLAEYEVAFKNIGKVELKIDEASLAVSLVDSPALKGPMELLKPTEVVRKDVLPPQNLATDEALGHTYAPEEGTKAGTVVRVKRAPGRILLFELTMRVSRTMQPRLISRVVGLLGGLGAPEDESKAWKDHRWGYVCEKVDLKEKPPQARTARAALE